VFCGTGFSLSLAFIGCDFVREPRSERLPRKNGAQALPTSGQAGVPVPLNLYRRRPAGVFEFGRFTIARTATAKRTSARVPSKLRAPDRCVGTGRVACATERGGAYGRSRAIFRAALSFAITGPGRC